MIRLPPAEDLRGLGRQRLGQGRRQVSVATQRSLARCPGADLSPRSARNRGAHPRGTIGHRRQRPIGCPRRRCPLAGSPCHSTVVLQLSILSCCQPDSRSMSVDRPGCLAVGGSPPGWPKCPSLLTTRAERSRNTCWLERADARRHSTRRSTPTVLRASRPVAGMLIGASGVLSGPSRK